MPLGGELTHEVHCLLISAGNTVTFHAFRLSCSEIKKAGYIYLPVI